jgi:polyhydroxybutyrate depolymerase
MRTWLGFLAVVTLAACGAKTAATDDTQAAADVEEGALANDAADVAAGTDAVSLPALHAESLGGARPVDVTVPDDWTPQKKWPLVLVLHGYGASGLAQSAYLGVQARATQYGYVTLAPDGTRDPKDNLFWNATPACCDFGHVDVDDVAYLTGLIDEAIAKLSVDPARVYVVGHSNGGFMAYRLACEKSDKINAIAVIAGATNPDVSACKGPKPVNVLDIHGTKDDTIAYDGGSIEGSLYPGAQENIGQWLARDSCDVTPTSIGSGDFDGVVAGNETDRLSYGHCTGSIAVEHWKMVGSGHIPAFTDDFREALATWLTTRTRP